MEVSGELYIVTALLPGMNPGTRWVGEWLGSRRSQDLCKRSLAPALGGGGGVRCEGSYDKCAYRVCPVHAVLTVNFASCRRSQVRNRTRDSFLFALTSQHRKETYPWT